MPLPTWSKQQKLRRQDTSPVSRESRANSPRPLGERPWVILFCRRSLNAHWNRAEVPRYVRGRVKLLVAVLWLKSLSEAWTKRARISGSKSFVSSTTSRALCEEPLQVGRKFRLSPRYKWGAAECLPWRQTAIESPSAKPRFLDGAVRSSLGSQDETSKIDVHWFSADLASPCATPG